MYYLHPFLIYNLITSHHMNNIWKFHWNPFINVGGVSRTGKFGRFLDNQGEITFDWEVQFKNKKCHTLLHITVNNIWKFHWKPFINVGGVSRTRKKSDGQTPVHPPAWMNDLGYNIIRPFGCMKIKNGYVNCREKKKKVKKNTRISNFRAYGLMIKIWLVLVLHF